MLCPHQSQRRSGIVLLVVITLLTLFAVVGITFVIYSQAEAGSARAHRESESLQRPDMDPEMLLAYFLNQLIYDTNNPLSALRGHSLGRSMYGTAGGTMPFNGPGRFHTAAPDTYYQVDYTQYNGAAINPDTYGILNVPYTYPDFNNLWLTAVRASDGAVLIPSYLRTNPQGGNPISLRPSLAYHTGFPAPEDGIADVKNLPDSPGFFNPTTGQFTNNDSIWIDLGFPVLKAKDGRKYKPLFAPLVQDLDNRVNVNAHGNCLSDIIQRFNTWCISHQGWSPGEVSLDRVISGPGFEVANIFCGNGTVKGRYDPTVWPPGGTPVIADQYTPGGHFYSCSDIDCWRNAEPDALVMPAVGVGFSYPWYNEAYSNSWWQGPDKSYAPTLYNYFDPTQNWYGNGGFQRLNNRRFPNGNLEALLRYSDKGSPALTSDLFALCPQSFQSAKTRRQATTLSMDLARPGVMPAMYNPTPGNPSPYQLAAGLALAQQYPTRPAIDFPAKASLPTGEFGANWGAMADAVNNILLRNRLDLNRGFVDYPVTDGTSFQFSNAAGYGPAMQSRQQLAQEVFDILRAVTGAGNPATATVNTPEYDALRYLAQLAVNIVDFVNFPTTVQRPAAPDDVMTMFNWNPTQQSSVANGWVFGTVLPRLVVNEAYVEITNTQNDLTNKPNTATQYDVNCWVELHNPFSSDSGGGVCNSWPAVSTAYNGTARLYVPSGNYAAYRIVIAQTVGDGTMVDNTTVLTGNSNVLGIPQNIKAVVDQYTPDPAAPQPLVLAGDNLNQVQPANLNRGNNVNTKITNSAAGNNQGFYVLGPKTPFPGTSAAANCFATLPVKEQAQQQNDTLLNAAAAQSSMHYVFTPSNPAMNNFTGLNHTVALQRLACPYMPPNFDPTNANFNPYVTVDYVLKAPINDNVTIDGAGAHNPTPVAQRFSVGRNQPYAADLTQQVKQLANYDFTQLNSAQPPPNAPAGQQTPQNTFFCMNIMGQSANGGNVAPFAYDWLFFANRLLISPMELLLTSGYKPSQLTQMFMTQGTDPNTGQPTPAGKFAHRAPWYQSGSVLYRAFEFFEAGLRPQWSPIGGRFTGRININNIWDIETLQALCDVQGSNYFTNQAVINMFNSMLKSRSPNGVPAPGDRPFLGMAAPFAPAGVQYPIGASVDDTFLRTDPNAPANNPTKRLFEVNPDQTLATPEMRADPYTGRQLDQVYLKNELMIKIFNSVTTRSNTFAVWLTVGFFEVLDDSNANAPPKLGQEIGRSENRHIRHRMFAIVDRTNMTLDPNNQGNAGPRPWFINSMTAVTASQVGAATNIVIPASAFNNYEEATWSITTGNKLVVDTGNNQETVQVTGVANVGQGLQITATFTKPHDIGFPVSNAVLGYPGPQTVFDMRNGTFNGVVRYFSLIE